MNYTYDVIWKDKLIKTTSQDFTTNESLSMEITYDECGNPLAYGDKSLNWSAGNRLDRITSINKSYMVDFAYDQDGFRIQKRVTGQYLGDYTWDYILEDGKIVQQTRTWNSSTLKMQFIYDSDDALIGFVHGGRYFYYIRNMQNDIISIVDEQGDEVVVYSYDTWGKMSNITGSLAYSVGLDNPFRYRGYFYDGETGFYYLGSRYYDPETGRFISPDSAFDIENIQRYNLYMYCKNNPVNFIDPSGRWALRAIGIAIGASVFGVIAYQIGKAFGLTGKSLNLFTASFVAIGGILGGIFGPNILRAINKLVKPVIYFFSTIGKVPAGKPAAYLGVKFFKLIQFELHNPHHSKWIHFVISIVKNGRLMKVWEYSFRK